MKTPDYIAPAGIYPEWLLSVSEYLTIAFGGVLAIIFIIGAFVLNIRYQ